MRDFYASRQKVCEVSTGMLPDGVFIKMWNYDSIIKRLKKNNTIDIIMAGKIESGHPLYILQYGIGSKKILLSAGIHGDELTGVEALLRFLEVGEGGRGALKIFLSGTTYYQ